MSQVHCAPLFGSNGGEDVVIIAPWGSLVWREKLRKYPAIKSCLALAVRDELVISLESSQVVPFASHADVSVGAHYEKHRARAITV
jgi:hypothetical protein